MDDMQKFFLSLNEEETEVFLKDIEVTADPVLSDKIKANLSLDKKGKVVRFPLKKILPVAAMFLVVFTCAFVFINERNKQPEITQTPVTTLTTQQPPADNPLMVAISLGNDSLIEKLLTSPEFISKETLDFALNFANLLSYETIHELALSVQEALGTTGLDSLVECTLMGDSKRALDALRERDEMLMTPFEKLAFFFAVAFCDSDVVDEFINRGYDINTTDASGNSIYAIAKKYGNTNTMEYAASKGITS